MDALGYAPKLVDSFNSYNIVHYAERYIGVPHAAGPVNVDTADLSSIPAILIAATLDDVKRQIGETERDRQPAPQQPARRRARRLRIPGLSTIFIGRRMSL